MQTKMKTFMRKCLPQKKKTSASEMKTKANKLLSKSLLKIAIKTHVLGKPRRKKIATTLNSKLDSTNQLSIVLNAFATSNNVFNEITEDEEVNDNVKIDNNPQKSQPEVKSRPNVAITENYIDITITLKIT